MAKQPKGKIRKPSADVKGPLFSHLGRFAKSEFIDKGHNQEITPCEAFCGEACKGKGSAFSNACRRCCLKQAGIPAPPFPPK